MKRINEKLESKNVSENIQKIYHKTVLGLLEVGNTYNEIMAATDVEISAEVETVLQKVAETDFNEQFEQITKDAEECNKVAQLKVKEEIKSIEKEISKLNTIEGSKELIERKQSDLKILNGRLVRMETAFKSLDKRLTKFMDMSESRDLSSLYPITFGIKTFSTIANGVRTDLLNYYPEFRRNKIVNTLSNNTNYVEALNLATKMFDEIYITSNAEYSAKQLLHTLINCKRGVYNKNRLAQTMLAIVGGQASGKTTFANCLYEAIHKEECCLGTLSLTSLIGRSVKELGSDYLLVINEKAFFDRNNTNSLKDLITSETYTYTPLYRNPLEIRKTAQIIITSNSDMNDTFWIDGSSRRLSQITMEGIKKHLTREELVELLTQIWELTPVDFPYDPIEFVNNENIKCENREKEDEILEIFSSHEKTDFVSFTRNYKTVSQYLQYLELKARDKVRNYLNNPEYFTKKMLHGNNYYKPTEKYFNMICESIDLSNTDSEAC